MAEAEKSNEAKSQTDKAITTSRKIPGNLPYLTASGTLKRALDGLIVASRPDKFNADFLENVLKLSGGSARATIPILKKMGFLTSDGVPTDIYAKFRTEGGRGPAALQALRNGFPEIFKRSEYAHTVDDNKIKDIVLEITGLKASDTAAQAIKSTFNVVKSFIPAGINFSATEDELPATEDSPLANANVHVNGSRPRQIDDGGIRLAYNINIILPETSDLKVLNAIFRSLKENLLQ